jgi:bacterial/archaeal transporter family-2 protein
MIAPSAIVLALAAGASLALQYTIMLAIMERGIGPIRALFINSLVGLVLLAGIEFARQGPSFATELAARARLWFVLPGLLGTFFVFASLYGYEHQGAAATTVLVVAAQLVTGILLDQMGLTGATRPFDLLTLVGAVLLVFGAIIVVR